MASQETPERQASRQLAQEGTVSGAREVCGGGRGRKGRGTGWGGKSGLDRRKRTASRLELTLCGTN